MLREFREIIWVYLNLGILIKKIINYQKSTLKTNNPFIISKVTKRVLSSQ